MQANLYLIVGGWAERAQSNVNHMLPQKCLSYCDQKLRLFLTIN